MNDNTHLTEEPQTSLPQQSPEKHPINHASHSQQHPTTYQSHINDNHSQVSQQEIPDHFYDSDIASVCEKDFLSDNQPPKDIVQERKLLYKEKLLHVFKTIIRVGQGIDKPARYDRIKVKMREVSKQQIRNQKKQQKAKNQENETHLQNSNLQPKNESSQPNKEYQPQSSQRQAPQKQVPQQDNPIVQQKLPPYYSTAYLDQCQQTQYNIGNEYQQIQRLITSMKRGQTALFQFQHLTVSKKSNIKVKAKTQIHVIHVYDWTTVIDLDGDKKLLKYVLNKGEGAFRIALYDKIWCTYEFFKNGRSVEKKVLQAQRLQKDFIAQELPNSVWRVLTSMKDKESVRLEILNQNLEQFQGNQFYHKLEKTYNQKFNINHQQKIHQLEYKPTQAQEIIKHPTLLTQSWTLTIKIHQLTKVDDIHLDGRILKQTYVKGVSTAKPESSSLIFYALKFIDNDQKQLKVDECFGSDWWEDFGKLDQLKGIRKNHLDDFSISKLLRKAIKRMKPAQIALVQCRDNQLFQYGSDYDQLKALLGFTQTPQIVKFIVRVYNFTQAKTAFNMEIEQKIIESKRKKQIAIKLLNDNKIEKALKRFQSIIAFYSSQKINQQAYEQKVSALMNSILCYMKLKKYPEMISLCNEVLLKPRHGHQFKDIKIVGPGNAKIEGSLPKSQGSQEEDIDMTKGDTRRIAGDLVQNQKTVDKCLYRKAFALVQTGECEEALKSLNLISESMNQTEQVIKLKAQALKGKQKYEEKSKKIFKTMFG